MTEILYLYWIFIECFGKFCVYITKTITVSNNYNKSNFCFIWDGIKNPSYRGRWRLYYLALSVLHFPIDSSPAFFTFSNFLGDRPWLMGPLTVGALSFLTNPTNERYATDWIRFFLMSMMLSITPSARQIILKPVFHSARIVPKRTGEHVQIEKRFINPRTSGCIRVSK
jgi:hypothetical protein